MVGIIGAMQIEVASMKENMENLSVSVIAGIAFYCGEIDQVRCVVANCGVGKVNAAACTQIMILKYAPAVIINLGVAGGVGAEIQIGDAVLATAVVQHDIDITAFGEPKGLVPVLNRVEIPADQRVVDQMARVAKRNYPGSVFKGVIATGDRFVASPVDMHEIFREFGAVAIEMEGGSVGQVCALNQVPFAVFRAISDHADRHAAVDFPTFSAEAAQKSATFIRHLLPLLETEIASW